MKDWTRQKETDQNTIWHFTRIEALPKILSATGVGLLSSHVRFLEDPADGDICRPIAEEAGEVLFHLMEQTKELHGDQAVKRMRELANLGIKLSMFVTCFCKEIDSPFMWRVYTRSGGCAIGFRKNSLVENLVAPRFRVIKSDECSYPPSMENAKREFDVQKKKMLDLFCARMAFSVKDDSKQSALMDSFSSLYQLAIKSLFVKNRFFRDEKEFRIVQSPLLSDGLKDLIWVDGKPRLPLKTKIPLAEMVEEIVVSPLGNVQQNMSTALLVSEATGIDCQKVRVYSPS